MALFETPRHNKTSDKSIAQKSRTVAKAPTTSRGGGLLSQIEQIKRVVDTNLGKYKDDYVIISDTQTLSEFFRCASLNGVIAIDTETTGLDPLIDKIVGLCLYTPNMMPAYVPINHVSYITGARSENQLTETQVSECFAELHANTTVVMFNAKFDMRVIWNTLKFRIWCNWDCYLASRLMNENEQHKGLKALHQKYVLKDQEDEFKYEALFKGVSADKIPISSFYLYAAHDAIITYELYEFQKPYLTYYPTETLDSRNGMNGVAWVFHNIEMPCIDVVAEMENTGIELDLAYARELSNRYGAQLQAKFEAVMSAMDTYSSKIEMWLISHENAKIDNPINIGSPTQIAIFLYDIMGIPPVDNKFPRGTGEAILSKIVSGDGYEKGVQKICQAILDYRGVQKLISTYIDKLPEVVNPNDGRIHCSFNQYGADTGRFSSSDPNLQNIPSHNKDIRKMFKATDDKEIVNSKYDDISDLNYFEIDRWCEVNTPDGWVSSGKLVSGSILRVSENNQVEDIIVRKIETLSDKNRILVYY